MGRIGRKLEEKGRRKREGFWRLRARKTKMKNEKGSGVSQVESLSEQIQLWRRNRKDREARMLPCHPGKEEGSEMCGFPLIHILPR